MIYRYSINNIDKIRVPKLIFIKIYDMGPRPACGLRFFFVALRPNAGHGLLILEVSRSHTTTQHSR
jgi:hypothetical protein